MTSRAFEFQPIPWEQYEEWILVEAQVEVIWDLGQTGFVYETTLEEARIKARDARLSCGYNPDTPQHDSEGDGEEDLPDLEDSASCDSAFGRDHDEAGGRDQGEGRF